MVRLRQFVQDLSVLVCNAIVYAANFNPNVATEAIREGVAALANIDKFFDVLDAHAIVVAGAEYGVGEGEFGALPDIEARSFVPTFVNATILDLAIVHHIAVSATAEINAIPRLRGILTAEDNGFVSL